MFSAVVIIGFENMERILGVLTSIKFYGNIIRIKLKGGRLWGVLIG